jgi:hypothetical protein
MAAAPGDENEGIALGFRSDDWHLNKSIQHAIGSLEAPMTDSDLESKFTSFAESILTPEQIHALINLCWDVEKLSNAGAIAKAAVPS